MSIYSLSSSLCGLPFAVLQLRIRLGCQILTHPLAAMHMRPASRRHSLSTTSINLRPRVRRRGGGQHTYNDRGYRTVTDGPGWMAVGESAAGRLLQLEERRGGEGDSGIKKKHI